MKAAGLAGKPSARTEQPPSRRIREQHPRCAIDKHHTVLQALKPFGSGIMVEIAYPKLTMNANGAGDVRQRGLEDKHLLASNFIVPGCIGDCDQRRDSVTDEQICTHRR
jgi:hypothetical protein